MEISIYLKKRLQLPAVSVTNQALVALEKKGLGAKAQILQF